MALNDRKLLNIQALRACAVMLVVFSHLVHIEEKYGHGGHVLSDVFLYGVYGVDLFFVISGFVMIAVSQRKKGRKAAKPLLFLYNRVTRIYPVYWFYCSLVLAVYLLRPEMVNSSQGNQVNILASYLLWPQRLAPLLAVAWTLTHEMYFYIVFAVMLCRPRRHIQFYLVMWLIITIAGNLILGGPANPVMAIIFHPLTLEFIAGCFVALILFNGGNRYGRLCLCGGAALLILNILGCYFYFGRTLPAGWYRVLFFGLPSTLMVYGAVASEMRSIFRFPKWFISVGDASYSTYLSHILVLSFLGRLWYRLGLPGRYDNIGVLAGMLLAVLIFGHLSYKYLEKPIIHYSRRYRTILS
jgi:peptidoglycan/LPS O-acetylase OafA/YrhL